MQRQQQNVAVDRSRLTHATVRDLTVEKRRLVEIPYTATLGDTMNALVANCVTAVPVAAPPGHWIGAGGSMIMESDKHTGAVRKHYIGMVTMLDILAHIAGDDDVESEMGELDQKMGAQVSSIIGHCLEGLNLWTLNPNTSILEGMEVLSKGIHRALVPVESNASSSGVELVESASCYKMLTQMDVLRFIKDHHFQQLTSRSLADLAAINHSVYAITHKTTVFNAIKSMRRALLIAVPIVQAPDLPEDDHKQLINGRQRKLVGTFSATDLRGCRLDALQAWLPLTALEFTEKVPTVPLFAATTPETQARELVTCRADEPLSEAIEKVVTRHVHRVWVVGEQGSLQGLVSLTDIIRSIREALV
ncbi:PREDICTED: SNF1-related protein kinase regulatory subunit gamma-like PV42a [Tarenaya hassleriana]|uniref:SNF1-related protein kinase regulatory subunit gamma-like PV42a n=1 Tax=Tarenaya hassleriana TaxID=28532 RepID=UPI00053C17CA|nr:PREDICTED: SNF1-related protein kinase regulatory subunit gamma-like PV42a [Tarenaya hassleriana]